MTTLESIQSRQPEIEVAAPELPNALMLIREAGGWCPSIDVGRCKYTLKVYWSHPEEKQTELL